MSDIAAGSLVKHVSLGIGKVVAIEATAVHVFFPQSEGHYAAKLRWPAARSLVTQDGIEPDPWLAGLTSFALDRESGRYALATNFVSHADAIAEFLKCFPQGFADEAYVGEGTGKRARASRWRAATSDWLDAFGGGQGERLLADGELREVIARALGVARRVTAVSGVIAHDLLVDALAPRDVVAEFFAALFGLLSAPSRTRPRCETLFRASAALGMTPSLAWPVATLFPAIAEPSRHVFLLPRWACGGAARLGCDLRYKPEPSWSTYDALCRFSEQLLEELRAHGARDHIDVVGFLHAIATRVPVRKR